MALPLAVVGLTGVALYNRWLWQRDKELLARTGDPEPLPPLEEWPRLPQVSVLVAAWNEADFIQRHIHSFLTLRYPNRELVLCAGGQDGTHALAHQHAGGNVILLEQLPGEGKQRALARSLPRSRGDIIFLTDADCLLSSESFERLIYPLVCDGEVIATGVSRPLADQIEREFVRQQWASHSYAQLGAAARYSTGILGRNCVLNRQVVENAWENEVGVPTGTDYYLALRVRQAGHRIRHVPGSSVETEFPLALTAYIRQRTRWLRNLLFWGYRFGDWYHVIHALTTSAVGTFLLLPLLPILVGWSGLVLWLLTWFAFGASRLRYAMAATASQTTGKLRVSASMCRLMIGDAIAWARAPADILWKTRRARW
jgi:cellulose synthase/poly-beta-1,6-N-acetylglucosamine synthase-like glycosyltransferase